MVSALMAPNAVGAEPRSARRQCAHCSLPLPARPHFEMQGGEALPFCCIGCVLVFRVIGSSGEGGRADWFLAKLGLATLLSGNVMLFQSLSYFGALESLGADALRTSSWIMLVCSLAVFALLGVPMLRIAGRELRRGRITLEALIGGGALAAIGFSATQTLQGGQYLYYDSGTMVLVFVTLGQYLDAESRRRALALLSPTMSRSRRQARVRRNAVEVCVVPDAIAEGETVYVRAGEEIPVDGTVMEGTADVHEPILTGEWQPRRVTIGDLVVAGSTSVDGALSVRASGAAETLADRVARFAIEARDRRAPIEALVDRVVAVFVPAVIMISAGTFLLWGMTGQWPRGFQAALAVLVVACPCALGIATPMATTIALSRAIGRGCLVRSGAVLERLSRLRAVAFDKTGTITTGRPSVSEFHAASEACVDSRQGLRLAAGLEQEVSHPYARAIVEYARVHGAMLPPAFDVRVTAGAGAEGWVEGRRVVVGKVEWLAARGIKLPHTPGDDLKGSAVALAVDECYCGEWLLEDPPRPDAVAALAALARMRISCHLISGDHRAVVARVAAAVGIADFSAGQSPSDKPQRLQKLRQSAGLIAMVGDGVNDAPAFGAADVGIAFGPAADLAREMADVTVLREDLREVPGLIDLSRKTFRIVRQNLIWAFAYNSIGVLLAAFGLLRPVIAAAAMVLSSLCVVFNSMRLRHGAGGLSSTNRPMKPGGAA